MATSPMISYTRNREDTKPHFYTRVTKATRASFPPHALKGQKHLAQGNTLGISTVCLASCKGKSIKNARIVKMKTREEYIALIASHAEELQNTFGITSLRLFGSVARNEHHEGSDVDVFVEIPPKVFLLVRLKAYLEELLDNPVEKDGIEVIAER